MGGYFWGCALKFFSQKLINIAEFRCEKKRYRGQTRGVIRPYFTVINLTQHGSNLPGLQFKNETDRRKTREVTGAYFTVNFFTKHGT